MCGDGPSDVSKERAGCQSSDAGVRCEESLGAVQQSQGM